MRPSPLKPFLFLLFFPILSHAQEKEGGLKVTVLIDQLRNDKGKVMVEMKNAEEERVSGLEASIIDGTSKVSFKGLEKGRYAVRLFHDENANGELDRQGMLPNEGYGHSNNVKGKMGRPDFSDQLFELEQDTTIRIHTIYRGE